MPHPRSDDWRHRCPSISLCSSSIIRCTHNLPSDAATQVILFYTRALTNGRRSSPANKHRRHDAHPTSDEADAETLLLTVDEETSHSRVTLVHSLISRALRVSSSTKTHKMSRLRHSTFLSSRQPLVVNLSAPIFYPGSYRSSVGALGAPRSKSGGTGSCTAPHISSCSGVTPTHGAILIILVTAFSRGFAYSGNALGPFRSRSIQGCRG